MTLIAALVCDEAVVFAADSEESDSIRKSNVEKIDYRPKGIGDALAGLGSKKRTSVVVAGAGNGALSDYAMQRIVGEVPYCPTKWEAEQKIVGILQEIFKVNVPLHPVSDPSEANFELLIGTKSPDWPTPILYSTHGVTLVKRDKYFVCGSGALADYILDQIYFKRMAAEDGIVAALYMLQVAKAYVGGVGGKSHIRILRTDGEVESKPEWETTAEENMAQRFSQIAGHLLLATMRTRGGTDVDFLAALKSFDKEIKSLRQRKKKSDKFMDAFTRELRRQREAAQKRVSKTHDAPDSDGSAEKE